MGSGGGCGGGPSRSNPSKRSGKSGRPTGAGGGGSASGAPSDCELSFETELSAVDADVLADLEVGDVLTVAIIKRSNFDVAICRDIQGRPVGSIANVSDLGQLIACMHQGVAFAATIRTLGRGSCLVFVERSL